MTSNQLDLRKVKNEEDKTRETRRSNKAKERLERRKQNMQFSTDTISNLSRSLNDAAWYNMDKQMVKDTARVSFDTPLGYKVKDVMGSAEHAIHTNIHPGICILKFIPTIGGDSQIGDISAIASKNIYAFVRHANSGSRNYEASDLMMYLYAIDQGYSYHGFLAKLYSLILDCKGYNRYYISQMIKSLGVDPDSLRDNIASFRAYINSYAVRLNSFYAPNSLPLFKRHYWLNNTIFKDSDIKKSQNYMFLQDSFGVYDDQNGEIKFTHQQFSPDNENLKGFEDLTFIGNRIINGLLNSEDAGIMSGDILKAYGSDKMLYLPSISEDYHIESVYSLEVLSQIANAIAVGDIANYNIKQRTNPRTLTSEIYQGTYLTQFSSAQNPEDTALSSNKFGLLCRPTMYVDGVNGSGVKLPNDAWNNTLINFYKDEPTEDDIMVATRLAALPENVLPDLIHTNCAYRDNGEIAADANTKWGVPLKYFGTEVVTYTYIVTLTEDPEVSDVRVYKTLTQGVKDNIIHINEVAISIQQTRFDWAPRFGFYNYYVNEDTMRVLDKVVGLFYDGANYASVSSQSLGNMHYTAVISELGVPLLGYTVRTR